MPSNEVQDPVAPAAATLFTIDRGSGEPVILLHSGGMSSRQWKKLSDLLAPRFRVLAPDFLGCGENALWPAGAPFHFDMDVAAVLRLVGTLDGPAHLVGHSYGGLVALGVAMRSPEKVRSLWLYEPVAFGILYATNDAEGLSDLAASGRTDANLSDSVGEGGSAIWLEGFIDYWNGPGAWKQLPEASRAAFLRVGPKVFLEVQSLLADRTTRESYRRATAPAVFAHGERSPVAARRTAAALAAELPRGTLITFGGAGHMGPLTHSSVVNAEIVRHLSSEFAKAG